VVAFWSVVGFLILLSIIQPGGDKPDTQRTIQTSEATTQTQQSNAAAIAKAREAERIRVAALQKEQKTEQEQRMLRRLKNLYFTSVRQRVTKQWLAMGNGNLKADCIVSVLQNESGEILRAVVDSCEGNDSNVRKAVKKAVMAASPLPAAPIPRLFDRRVKFYFRH